MSDGYSCARPPACISSTSSCISVVMSTKTAVLPLRQHPAPASHRSSQRAADDGSQYEPDFPDRRLAIWHLRINRGVIGHLLNGYDTRYLKKNLRGAPKPPDQAAAIPVGNF